MTIAPVETNVVPGPVNSNTPRANVLTFVVPPGNVSTSLREYPEPYAE